MFEAQVPPAESPMDVAAVLAFAEAETGLSDWGPDPAFRIGLQVLLDAIEAMNPAVPFRTKSYARIQHILSQRLHMRDDEKRHPEILAPIDNPLVVTGLPRSGTTVTFDLLALAPDARTPREWECYAPWPAPEIATFDTDPRIEVMTAAYGHLLAVAPEFADVQRVDCTQPGECNHIMMMNFDGSDWWAELSVPRHMEWMSSEPSDGMYRSHKRVLQQLQWKGPKGRWLIKSPHHMFDLAGLIETYSEASIVWTHRDPVSTMSSLSSMVSMLQKAFGAPVDLKQIGGEISEIWVRALLKGVEARKDPDVERRIIDIPQRDVISDPRGVVRRVHERFGIPFTAEHAARIDTFLAESVSAKRLGRHKHDAATFGIDADTVNRRLAPYFERFGPLLEGSAKATAA
jgi:hypothetical protein